MTLATYGHISIDACWEREQDGTVTLIVWVGGFPTPGAAHLFLSEMLGCVEAFEDSAGAAGAILH